MVTRLYSEGPLIWRATSLKDHWSEGPLVWWTIAPNYIVVSALFCATTQQSYTPGTGVHRMSSVVVCKVVNRQADYCKLFWKVPYHHIPRAFLLWNFIYYLFLGSFLFVSFCLFLVTWDLMGGKFQTTLALKVHHRRTHKSHVYWWGGSPLSFWYNCKISNLAFLPFFPFC